MEDVVFSPIVVALIAAAATIISAIISAVIARNGLNFWSSKRTYKLTGTGKDLNTMSWRGEIYDHATPFKYHLKTATLAIENDKSTLTATVSVCREDGTDVAEGKLKAFGINEGGVAHMSYQISDYNSSQQWQGVMLLRISNLGELNGLWISDSSAEPGWCTFGNLTIERR